MSRQTPKVQNRGAHTPVVVVRPQVVLTLVNNQTQIGSNIAPGPQAWRVIAQMCLQGAQAALHELAREEEPKDPPRVVVPTGFQVNGRGTGEVSPMAGR